MKSNLTNEVKSNINQIDEVIKMKIQGYDKSEKKDADGNDTDQDIAAQIEKDLGNMYAHLLRGDARHSYMA